MSPAPTDVADGSVTESNKEDRGDTEAAGIFGIMIVHVKVGELKGEGNVHYQTVLSRLDVRTPAGRTTSNTANGFMQPRLTDSPAQPRAAVGRGEVLRNEV